jgi:hypothetical protein
MKKSACLLAALVSLACSGGLLAQEATPEPSPTPTATPAASVKDTDKPKTAPASEATSSDADLLPEPAETGSAEEPPPPPAVDEALPTDDSGAADALNPDDTLVPPDATGLPEDVPPPAPTIVENKYKAERELKVRYQEVKLQALKDAKVRSLHEQAEAAKTDEGKRQALREYYRLLFAKMVAIDGDLQTKCEEMERAYLRRLGQYRVAPSIPLQPPPTPEPLELAEASPTPTPKPKRGN